MPASDDGHGVTLHACCLRPQSCGEIRLASADPPEPPVMDPRYLSFDHDLRDLARGLAPRPRYFGDAGVSPWLGEERLPGTARQSDAEL